MQTLFYLRAIISDGRMTLLYLYRFIQDEWLGMTNTKLTEWSSDVHFAQITPHRYSIFSRLIGVSYHC